MNGFFKKNLSIKLFSLFAAVFLWLIVLNTQNPIVTRKIELPLTIENENTLQEKNLVLKNNNYKKTVDITIRGRTEVVEAVSADDFKVWLDFSKVVSVKDTSIPITGPYYNIKDISVVMTVPEMIDIQVERIGEITLPVDVVLNGNPKAGYKIISVTRTPEEITLEAFESVVKNAASIKAVVDVSNLDKELTVKKECKVYNKNGEEITSLGKNLSVDIKISVAREVPVRLVTKGTPANDHVEISRQILPARILVTGTNEALAKISEIVTEALDITGADTSIHSVCVLRLPNGIKLVNEDEQVFADIGIEKLAVKDFTIIRENIDLINTDAENLLKYEIMAPSVLVVVKARQSVLDNMPLSDIKVSLDMAGLGEGTHNVMAEVQLPLNTELAMDVFAVVIITKNSTGL